MGLRSPSRNARNGSGWSRRKWTLRGWPARVGPGRRRKRRKGQRNNGGVWPRSGLGEMRRGRRSFRRERGTDCGVCGATGRDADRRRSGDIQPGESASTSPRGPIRHGIPYTAHGLPRRTVTSAKASRRHDAARPKRRIPHPFRRKCRTSPNGPGARRQGLQMPSNDDMHGRTSAADRWHAKPEQVT